MKKPVALKIEEELQYRMKVHCAQNRINIQDFVAKALEHELKKQESKHNGKQRPSLL